MKRVLLVLLLSASSLSAQVLPAGFQIAGRVQKSGSLELAAADPETVQGSVIGGREVHVRLRPSGESRMVTVPLIARTNAGSTHLMPEATNVRVLDASNTVEGSRISNGGNDRTIDNAIRLALDVELPQNISEADVIFTMTFPEN